MKAYRVKSEKFGDAIACGENASKVRSFAIHRIRSVYPSYTWKEGMQSIKVHREARLSMSGQTSEQPLLLWPRNILKKDKGNRGDRPHQ